MCVANKIGDDGAVALADALKTDTALRTLELHCTALQLPCTTVLGGTFWQNYAQADPRGRAERTWDVSPNATTTVGRGLCFACTTSERGIMLSSAHLTH